MHNFSKARRAIKFRRGVRFELFFRRINLLLSEKDKLQLKQIKRHGDYEITQYGYRLKKKKKNACLACKRDSDLSK